MQQRIEARGLAEALACRLPKLVKDIQIELRRDLDGAVEPAWPKSSEGLIAAFWAETYRRLARRASAEGLEGSAEYKLIAAHRRDQAPGLL